MYLNIHLKYCIIFQSYIFVAHGVKFGALELICTYVIGGYLIPGGI